jgi:molybdopterin-guanine dinucleotide biosynthesis protein A
MTARGVSAIVLAGGRSRRFGSDKLSAILDGRSLLDRSIDVVAGVADEVLVVLAPGDDRELPTADIEVHRVVDPERHGGPLVGLLAGLEQAGQPVVVLVGGDMPTMSEAVLDAMIRALIATHSADAIVLASRGDRPPLPAVIRTGAATTVARQLVADGERRLRGLFERLPARVLEETEWRPLDPAETTLRDIDRPADLPRDDGSA